MIDTIRVLRAVWHAGRWVPLTMPAPRPVLCTRCLALRVWPHATPARPCPTCRDARRLD